MEVQSSKFKSSSSVALQDEQLQIALGKVKTGFIEKRRKAIELIPEWGSNKAGCKAH